MPDYSKGKIYTIRCRTDDSKIYIGSTIQPLAVRFGAHKRRSRTEETKKLYIEVNGDWDNWYIELYENYPCNSREELLKKEGEIIRQIGTLNSLIAGRSKKEWYIENTDKKHQYYIDNINKILEQRKQHYIENSDKIKDYLKEYREKHKKEISEKRKEKYYLKKKADKILTEKGSTVELSNP